MLLHVVVIIGIWNYGGSLGGLVKSVSKTINYDILSWLFTGSLRLNFSCGHQHANNQQQQFKMLHNSFKLFTKFCCKINEKRGNRKDKTGKKSVKTEKHRSKRKKSHISTILGVWTLGVWASRPHPQSPALNTQLCKREGNLSGVIGRETLTNGKSHMHSKDG